MHVCSTTYIYIYIQAHTLYLYTGYASMNHINPCVMTHAIYIIIACIVRHCIISHPRQCA